jgi:2,3-bisphosphoglycerate-dependent phosphoglycerate mutase
MRTLILGISIVLYSICQPARLVLFKHGESEWEKLNLFTGWADVPLSDKGLEKAIQGGKLLKDNGFKFDICYTSLLKRSIQTVIHILSELDQLYVTVLKDYRLNEKHYGALQGLNKKETAKKYGSEKVKAWRRSFDIAPPALDEEDERNPSSQEQYKNIPKHNLPLHESLKDTFHRVISYYNEVISSDIKAGKSILISAHDHSLRALIKYLDNISDQEIIDIKIPIGVPLIYELDKDLKPIKRYYLGEQETIISKIEKNQETNSNLDIIMVDELNEQQKQDIFELIKSSDNDFIPPLSARGDTRHKFSGKQNGSLTKFYEEIIKESFLLLLNNGKVEGFFSFLKDHDLELKEQIVVCDYITIIIINSKGRNKGYTKNMYNAFLNQRKGRNVATRTWSLNYAHMHILDTLGFKLVQTDKDDRGVNIDTVYYLLKPNNDVE